MKIPYIEQFFGMWAIEESAFSTYYDLLINLDISKHMASDAPADAKSDANRTYMLDSGVAIIDIVGTMMKQRSSFSSGTSTVMARQQVRAAVNDPDVKSILLRIDSPGGTVAGTKELADDIAKANASKPVYAFIEDLGASAAYWVSSQASKVFANDTALVGSIGTYGVVQDLSGYAAREGIKVHVVRAGQYKGMGTPGTEITVEQLAELQRNVDALNGFFINGVAKGRNMQAEQINKLADGRVHIASEAKNLGLIDGVSTLQDVFDMAAAEKPKTKATAKNAVESDVTIDAAAMVAVASEAGASSEQSVDEKGQFMSTQPSGPTAATVAEIEAECVGATSDFVLSQLKAGATIEQSKSAWIKHIATRSPEPAPKRTGIQAVKQLDVDTACGSAKSQWDAAVADKRKSGMSLERAILSADKDNPGLRQAMIEEVNSARRAK